MGIAGRRLESVWRVASPPLDAAAFPAGRGRDIVESMESGSKIELADLVAPLPVERFRNEHWRAGVPYASQVNPALLDKVRAVASLASVEALLPHLSGSVQLLGPERFRAEVSVDAARQFLRAGFNVYIRSLERDLPDAHPIFAGVARELGFPPWQLTVEAFAGAAGGISSRHYDHDINFQILLRGEKLWRFEANATIENPLAPFHPALRPDGSTTPFEELARAKGPVPDAFDPARVTELRVSAGSVVFVPRGHWHEVESLSETWSVNVAFRGVTWATALGNALVARLHEDPEFRAYCENIPYGGDASTFQRDDAARQFERLRAAAIDALQGMTRNEAALSLLDSRYRWSSAPDRRAVVVDAEDAKLTGTAAPDIAFDARLAPVVERLAAFSSEFGWADALAVGRAAGAATVFNLLTHLVREGALVRVAAKPPRSPAAF